MKKMQNLFKESIPSLLYCFFLYLFPFIFAFDAYNEDVVKRMCYSAIYALIVGMVLSSCRNKEAKVFTIIISIIAFIPNTIVLAYLLMDNVIMKSTDFWVIFNTNISEATNLFSTLSFSVFIMVAIYLILVISGIIFLFKQTRMETKSKWVQIIMVFVLMCVSMINPFRSKVSAVDFYKSFFKYNKEKKDVADFYKNRQNLMLDVQRKYPKGKNTLLIIIGESQNRHHFQLYGYKRPTNPKLAEIKDELTLYYDVCSPAIQTLASMNQILTFSNYESPDMYKVEANIIELLRYGGYKTFWYDNQGESKNGLFEIDTYTPTSYRIMAKQSEIYGESGMHDSILLDKLKMALADTASNKAIFLHLMGSHFEYSHRYEKSYAFFTDSTNICSKYRNKLSDGDIEVINAYDNSIRYSDYILRSCIELVRAEGGRSAMLYFPDHGEEVFDYQYYYRRSFEKISPAMCEIPLILWMNDNYKLSNDLIIDTKRPYCSDDIIYGIMDIAGIRYKMYDAKRSLFSPSFVPKERYVQGMPYHVILDRYARQSNE